MLSNQKCLNHPQFIKVAYQLGYQLEDLDEPDEAQLEADSYQTTKFMSEVEKNYYLRKKKQALISRKQKIVNEITQHINKQNKQGKNRRKFSYNPLVHKILNEHQKKLNQKARYEQKIRISRTRNATRQNPNRNTIDLGRTSPNFLNISRNSQISRKSVRSESSSRSSNISRRSSHKDRLMLVRNKQKQIQHFKRNSFLQNQNKSKKKIDRVFQERESYSRKLKTRSQISQQAVSQKKAQLLTIQNQQIRNHIQSLHYKIFKHEVIRQKKMQEKIKNKDSHDTAYKKQIKQMFQQNLTQKRKQQYLNKMHSAQQKKEEVSLQKKYQIQQKAEQRKYKQLSLKKYRTHQRYQQAENNKFLQLSQEKSLQEAERKRNSLKSEQKIRMIANRVKEEINRSNMHSIERKKQMQTLQREKKYQERMNQLKQIEKLKKKLIKERIHFKGTTLELRNSRQQNLF